MPSNSLTGRLPSCMVSRELLHEMERYLRERTDALFPKDATPRSLVISVIGPKGTVTVPEVSAYPGGPFPDDTTAIVLNWNTGQIRDPQIIVQFSRVKRESLVSVAFDDPSVQETAQGVVWGIASVAASHRTRHHLYHSPIAWVFFALLWAGAVMIQWPRWKLHVWDAAIIVVTAAYFAYSRLLPFTTFDTGRNVKNEKWAARIRAGLLVGVLAVIEYWVVMPLVE